MSKDLNRRDFLKKSIIGSAAAASALSLEEKALLAGVNKPAKSGEAVKGMPTGKIGKVTISRLICGGNLTNGYAHSRDLIYVSDLLKKYFTDEHKRIFKEIAGDLLIKLRYETDHNW